MESSMNTCTLGVRTGCAESIHNSAQPDSSTRRAARQTGKDQHGYASASGPVYDLLLPSKSRRSNLVLGSRKSESGCPRSLVGRSCIRYEQDEVLSASRSPAAADEQPTRRKKIRPR